MTLLFICLFNIISYFEENENNIIEKEIEIYFPFLL
jgi:hypothetical protein